MIDRFFDQEKGGFFDIERDPEAIGHLQIREKPLPDNAIAALALTKLYQATRNEDYRQVAETALSAFVESYREYGEFAAAYGLAVDRLTNPPVEVTVEGPAGRPGHEGHAGRGVASDRSPSRDQAGAGSRLQLAMPGTRMPGYTLSAARFGPGATGRRSIQYVDEFSFRRQSVRKHLRTFSGLTPGDFADDSTPLPLVLATAQRYSDCWRISIMCHDPQILRKDPC